MGDIAPPRASIDRALRPEPDPFHDDTGTPVHDADAAEMAAWGHACWVAGVDPVATAEALRLA